MSACNSTNQIYWQKKLAAFLHDPPDKALSIWGHEERAKSILETLKIGEILGNSEKFVKKADIIASGMDRTFLPGTSQSGYIGFEKNEAIITHPTGGNSSNTLRIGTGSSTNNNKSVLKIVQNDWEEKLSNLDFFSIFHYFRHVLPYRLACEGAEGFRWQWWWLPADTRIPDHSIWQHCALTSALFSCYNSSEQEKASLVVFSITPVQDFIARSRKLRDYWTSSLILSWLTAEGIWKIVCRYGSDHVLYPYPVGQPMIERMLDEKCGFEEWRERYSSNTMAATLPNKFVFLVPAGEEECAAGEVQKAIEQAWLNLAIKVGDKIDSVCFGEIKKKRRECLDAFGKIFDRQVRDFWEFHWAGVPLLDSTVLSSLQKYLPEGKINRLKEYLNEALKQELPYTADTEKFFYPLIHDLVQRTLAAGKLTPEGGESGEEGIKCHLHPDLEALRFSCVECQEATCFITRGSSKDNRNPPPSADPCWQTIRNKWRPKTDFKETERLSAIALIKRLAYSCVGSDHPLYSYFLDGEAFPSTIEISAKNWLDKTEKIWKGQELTRKELAEYLHRQDSSRREYNEVKELRDREKVRKIEEIVREFKPSPADFYYGLLIMDGDRMGRLVSGELPSRWRDVIHPELVRRIKEGEVSKEFLNFWDKFLSEKRILSPAVHAAISQALADFSLFTVPLKVEKFGGCLVYAGGDDICALFPISRVLSAVLELADAYRWNFIRYGTSHGAVRRKGGTSKKRLIVEKLSDDSNKMADGDRLLLHLGQGEGISLSAGLLIVHHKWPLRGAVERAQALLKLAKRSGRNALAIELQRRAGERRTFIGGFDNSVWKSFGELVKALGSEELSASFVYRQKELWDGFSVLDEKDAVSFVKAQIKTPGGSNTPHYASCVVDLLRNGRKVEGMYFNPTDVIEIARFLAEANKRREK